MDFESEYYKTQYDELFDKVKSLELHILSLEIDNAELTRTVDEQEGFLTSVKNIQAFIGLSEELKAKLNKGSLDE